MSDSIDTDRLATLQGAVQARIALDGAREAGTDDRAGDRAADWFAADDAGLRLPITLDVAGYRPPADLDALADDILAPLAR